MGNNIFEKDQTGLNNPNLPMYCALRDSNKEIKTQNELLKEQNELLVRQLDETRKNAKNQTIKAIKVAVIATLISTVIIQIITTYREPILHVLQTLLFPI